VRFLAETETGCHDLMVDLWEAEALVALPDDLKLRGTWFTPNDR